MTRKNTTVYLIRHAHAGQRAATGRDIYRPVSERGAAEARKIAEGLADAKIDSILSSPATRCVQTVQELAQDRGLEVVEVENLWEDSLPNEMLTLIEACAVGENIALCSHGNLIPEVVEMLSRKHGVKVSGRGCEKGSVWELHRTDNEWVSARYVGTFNS